MLTKEELNLGAGAQLVGQDKYANRPVGFVDTPQNPVGAQTPFYTPTPATPTPVGNQPIQPAAPITPAPTPQPSTTPDSSGTRTVTTNDGNTFNVDATGQIVSGKSSSPYSVGSNINDYGNSAYLNALAGGQSENQAQVTSQAAFENASQIANAAALKLRDTTIAGYENGSIPLNAAEQAQVDGLKAQWQQTIDLQNIINTGASGAASTRGYASGAAENASFQTNVIGSVMLAGQAKINNLNIQMMGAVAALTDALRAKDIASAKDAYDRLNNAYKDRSTAIQDSIDKANAAIKVEYDKAQTAKKEQEDKVEKATNALEDAIKGGLTDPKILAQARDLANRGNLQNLLILTAQYRKTSTNADLQKYYEVEKSFAARGLQAPLFEDWSAEEDKKAVALKGSEAYASGFGTAAGKAAAEAQAEKKYGSGGAIANPAYAGVINTILSSGKFTKDQTAQIKNGIAHGEDPFSIIKNRAKDLMTNTNATKIESYENAMSAMDSLESNLKDYYANNGSTSIFSGNFEKVINKLGGVSDPKLVNLATQISSSLQVYRNAISGTAYSEQEGKDIASIFPGINKTQGLNQAILDGRRQASTNIIDGAYKNVLGNEYDKLKNLQKDIVPLISEDTAKNAINSFNVNPKNTDEESQIIQNAYGPGITEADVYEYIQKQIKEAKQGQPFYGKTI